MSARVNRLRALVCVFLLAGCGGRAMRETMMAVPENPPDSGVSAVRPRLQDRNFPELPPQIAYFAGLMPLRELGVTRFLSRFPEYDGRGVIIAIIDTGIDAGLAGLQETSSGVTKVLDLRDFSGEGAVDLSRVEPTSEGTVMIGDRQLSGFGRLARLAPPPYFGGQFSERTLGRTRAADVNGNGSTDDVFPVVVGRASDGWVVMTDTDGDGSLANERAVRDYLTAHETFTYRSASGDPGPLTIAVNAFGDEVPSVAFYFDNDGHGSHVAGIAAGHDMFGVQGFDGVAPGAYLLGLKISNNSRGSTSVTGGILHALNYAAVFAEQRGIPLVVNLSFGTGSEVEGAASIDSLVNDFTLKHPHVLVVISAGNDGPGISTVSQPATASYALSVCGLLPGAFAQASSSDMPSASDMLGWWSSRGGEVAKPDLCAPGVAYSNVPRWRTGAEVSAGTSMASPQVAGAAALLLSAFEEEGRFIRAVDLKMSLLTTATRIPHATVLDAGRGVPDVQRAYRWLQAAHQAGLYLVEALPSGGNTSIASAAYRRAGFQSESDSIQRFRVTSVGGQPAATLLLESDVPWLRSPETVEFAGSPVTIELVYDTELVREPGLYVGSVWATSATDTLAGPMFALTNTIVVATELRTPVSRFDSLGPGQSQRYFFQIGADAAGLHVELESLRGVASLHVFEPSGQPHRCEQEQVSESNLCQPNSIHISANDVVPGVYEITVTASQAWPVSYRLGVETPPLRVGFSEPLVATLFNHSSEAVMTEVRGRVVGFVRQDLIQGSGSRVTALSARVPDWADEIVIDIEMADSLWNQLTDLGLSVLDSSGNLLHAGWVKYARGRLRVPVEESWIGAQFDLELLPGFAHMTPPEHWAAQLNLAFMLRTPVALDVVGAPPHASLRVAFQDSVAVRFGPVPADIEMPEGFEPLVEIQAAPSHGATTTVYHRVHKVID